MLIRHKYPLILFIFVIFVLMIGCTAKVTLKNPSGDETSEFQVQDSIFFKAVRLKPYTAYTVQVVGEGERIVTESLLSTDGLGHIPETVLWYDIGIRQCSKKMASSAAVTHLYEHEISDVEYLDKSYTLRLLEDERPLRETAFRVTKEMKRPLLYVSDSRGCPKSGFLIGEEDVWVVGRNLPRGSIIRLGYIGDGGVRLAFLHLASSHTWLNAYVQA